MSLTYLNSIVGSRTLLWQKKDYPPEREIISLTARSASGSDSSHCHRVCYCYETVCDIFCIRVKFLCFVIL